MFERYITNALINHFGHVVENLDADKVRLSAWNGECFLEDLALRKNALENFVADCPVEIAHGQVGKLELRIPWKLFSSQLKWRTARREQETAATSNSNNGNNKHATFLESNCSIVLTDVNILITPRREESSASSKNATNNKQTSAATEERDNNHNEQDESLEKRRIQKERQVQSRLDATLLQRVTKSTASSRWNWVQEYLSNLLSTLSVTVRNIHIRYEDPGTSMGYVWSTSDNGRSSSIRRYRPAFAVGLTLQQFAIQTKDEAKTAKEEVEEDSTSDEKKDASITANEGTKTDKKTAALFEIRHKTASGERLAIYWDSNCQLISIHAIQSHQEKSNDHHDSPSSNHYSNYYESSFQILNGQGDTNFEDYSLYYKQQSHSYLLDPISPMIDLNLVSKKTDNTTNTTTKDDKELLLSDDSDESTTDTIDASSLPNTELTTTVVPPSSFSIDLPPCRFILSRSTLEDTAYIRKSISVWSHAKRGFLSESSLLRLAKLRPIKSPLEDPKKWWVYASEATISLLRVQNEGRDLDHLEFYNKRRRGWVGFAQAIERRRKYVKLYKEFLSCIEGKDEKGSDQAHQSLLEMEDGLFPREIVAFRIAVYDSLDQTRRKNQVGPKQDVESEDKILSVEHRSWMMDEMLQALEREKSNLKDHVRAHQRRVSVKQIGKNDSKDDVVIWKASFICRQFALQMNDESVVRHGSRRKTRITPIIRISSAWLQDHSWYQDGSWDTDGSLASLKVKDLTGQNSRQNHFPTLVCSKEETLDGDYVLIDDKRYFRSLSIVVRKRLHWMTRDGRSINEEVDRGSTTSVHIRILPLEIIYSTLPVEALSRVLATIKTPELVDDMHKMASAANAWRQRQKRKFLQALAHKHKKILMDVDVGSPVLLIPEDTSQYDSPMLAVDLGRLQISNEQRSLEVDTDDFDDKWRLALSNIQVRSTTSAAYFSKSLGNFDSAQVANLQSIQSQQQLVEPFSLDFTILTKIAVEDSQDIDDITRVHISATMPRLAFNLTSSAMRLVLRLKQQWERQKRERLIRREYRHTPQTRLDSFAGVVTQYSPSTPSSPSKPQRIQEVSSPKEASQSKEICRVVHFNFSAPLVTLRVSNDVDGRDCIPIVQEDGSSEPRIFQTPLIDLAFRGIRGKHSQETAKNGDSIILFDAQLHSLGAIDLYQHAGRDFALLMSSVPAEILPEELFDQKSWDSFHANHDHALESIDPERRKDLVTIEYRSKTSEVDYLENEANETAPDQLSIWFHELYVEWNPETIAAIQKALRLPLGQDNPDTVKRKEGVLTDQKKVDGIFLSDSFSEDEEFFDAEEDEFFDANAESHSRISLFSEQESRLPDAGMQPGLVLGPSPPGSPATSLFLPLSPERDGYHLEEDTPKAAKTFKVVFELSKLRISFNKEVRHRKVMIAQMEDATVSYTTRSGGGSRTKMRMGNLVFIDPAHNSNQTLYGQIIGLKSPEGGEQQVHSSLLEMEILINPAAREFTSDALENEETRKGSVRIDREKGRVQGCNNFIRATFSPMRFVFLEQLWFEIIDYFFEGIIGTEVWGGTKAPPNLFEEEKRALALPNLSLPGSEAEGFNFTRFDISLESPALLLPITYRSTQFLRLELASIHVANHYNGCAVHDEISISKEESNRGRMQWFNNCNIKFQGLRLYSWNGRELGKKAVVADVALRWPTGPLGYRIIPKWKVDVRFDNLDIALHRSDYALLQHIITYNIGELSRNLGEWEALQSLSPSKLEEYNSKIMVHYGYDKKDVAPSTYDLTLTIPLLSFSLITDTGVERTLAIARCLDLVWTLFKASDFVVKQKLTCDIELVTPSSTPGLFDTMLSMSKYDTNISSEGIGSQEMVPELTYTSTSRPTGDNVKTLEIVDPCIYMIVPAWRTFIAFFQALPQPEILDAVEIKRLVRVGDRWYRVGEDEATAPPMKSNSSSEDDFAWIGSYAANKEFHKRISGSNMSGGLPKFQFRVSFTWPRIILSSTFGHRASTRLILRMHHLEYLHTNDAQSYKISRSFFLHDVEVYTVSDEKPIHNIDDGENSLIRPWSVVGLIEKCNGESIGDCREHTLQVSGDVLEAHAAYSDVIIAVDVCMSILHSMKDRSTVVQEEDLLKSASSESSLPPVASNSIGETESSEESPHCQQPEKDIINITFDGFELKIADDSGRHFAGTQDLIILSLGKLHFSRETLQHHVSSIELRLNTLDLYDCLQDVNSPFRTAASSRSGAMGLHHSPSILEAANTKNNPRRKMDWDSFSLQKDGTWNFVTSPALVERAQQASTGRIPTLLENEAGTNTELIEISCLFSGTQSTDYTVKIRSFAVQWNPSTVIAIQRFLGRLHKESKIKASKVHDPDLEDLPSIDSSVDSSVDYMQASPIDEDSTMRLTINVDSLTVCLNKEHQNRRLLELTLSSCQMQLESSDRGLCVDGRLGDLHAWDSDNYFQQGVNRETITKANRNVLQVLSAVQSSLQGSSGLQPQSSRTAFLEVHYKTFKKRLPQSMLQKEVPSWVESHIAESGDIDDFLRVSVAATQFVYLRERTAEILDYLSNGLPGKGMGATSRAAKGFISKRILTKSFLEVCVDSPKVIVPQHESLEGGIMLTLGDVNMKSWFEEVHGDWWRMLSLGLTGFCGGMTRVGNGPNELTSATNPIDLQIELRKPTVKGQETAVQGNLSFLDLKMDYSDYALIRAVVRDNVGRTVDTESWDNVEKAYWLEEEDKAEVLEGDRVEYSSNARFIRYGKAGKAGKKRRSKQSPTFAETQSITASQVTGSTNTLDVRFKLDGLSLKLRRDDQVEGVQDEHDLAKAFQYDIVLLRVQLVEVSCTTNTVGDISFHLSLFRLGLFDLGDHGRLVRERYYSSLPSSPISDQGNGLRQPCPFHVLVEGYSETEDTVASSVHNTDNPQIVVNVDRCSASSARARGALEEYELPMDSKVTIAKVVVNNLSINALLRPFEEVAAFLSCEWQTKIAHVQTEHEEEKKKIISPEQTSDKPLDTKTQGKRNQGFQLKLVAHYPRVFFLADESDPHSRALVLRGLAVIHLNKSTNMQNEDVVVLNDIFSRTDTRHFTSLNAQLHSMESYINPDVDTALGFKTRHSEMVGRYSSSFPRPSEDGRNDNNEGIGSTLGVALIQPVTTGIEYAELSRDLFPTKRLLSVNIEPVSVGISFEDLQLIETVMKRWSKKSSANEDIFTSDSLDESIEKRDRARELYSVLFHSYRLGLGLKADARGIVVIENKNSEHSQLVNIGDILTEIEGQDFRGSPLDDVVGHLSKCKRPVSVTFERPKPLFVNNTLLTSDDGSLHSSSDGVSNESTILSKDDSSDAPCFVACYDIEFRLGISRGLELEKSICGSFPVVTRVLPTFSNATSGCNIDESNAEQIETTFEPPKDVRVPCAGAVIVAVNGLSVQELGVEEAFQRLSALAFEGEERNTYSSISDILQSNQIYSLSFMEADADVWGKVEEIDITTTGIAVSFIDDLKGRDMPLFRAKLSSVEIHAERGMGIGARILNVNVPALLKSDTFHDFSETEEVSLSQKQIEFFQSDTVVSLCGLVTCAVDYFHPRIACWEPLIEPSQLFFLLERIKGTRRRPGQIALELSDFVLHDQILKNTKPGDRASKMLTVNVTDAAAQVFVKASSQWKEWRQSVVEEAGDDGNESMTDELVREFKSISEQNSSATSFELQDVPKDHEITASHSHEHAQRYQEAQRFAAQKTAHAALVFAQKRGADNNKKVESAKPFIFRNRTGVSIAFVQQGQEATNSQHSTTESHRMSVVGEYSGLEEYDTQTVIELADKEDARFSMELISTQDSQVDTDGTKQAYNKIRAYEGRFPSLAVSIQAVSGVLVEPIVDLQVYKVGSEIRHLIVRKEADAEGDFAHYSIPVVWKVEIVDNRRILTLSTAVRVVSSGFNTSIEVGVHKDTFKSAIQVLEGNAQPISAIGVSSPESPFYLPLWLALRLDPVYIHVRPCSEDGSNFLWSESSVLHFGPLENQENGAGRSEEKDARGIGRWAWKETFSDLTFVQCNPVDEDSSPVQLSVFGSSTSKSEKQSDTRGVNDMKLNKAVKQDLNEVISVTLDSGLTLRNMLPMNLEWEVANTVGASWRIVDGSSWRIAEGSSFQGSQTNERKSHVFTFDHDSTQDKNALESGGCIESFACQFSSQVLEARFKCPSSPEWSSWAPLSIFEDIKEKDDPTEEELYDSLSMMVPRARQINVQVPDEKFGVPLTFGVRVVPKMTIPDDPYNGRVYGLEVIVYAELWIRNITSLPLNFGCPSYQVHDSVRTIDADGYLVSDESLARFTAESALMEIASLLEVGDKGTGLSNKRAKELAESGAIESLPRQESDQLVEEVFEYIEIDSSTVKRRWWASESYDSYRENMSKCSKSDNSWKWIDESWVVDCAGQAKARYGGWESCRSLFTAAGSFNVDRSFDPTHTFRRRRYFRKRTGHHASKKHLMSPSSSDNNLALPEGSLLGGLQAMHQPLTDSFSKEQRKIRRKQENSSKDIGESDQDEEKTPLKIAVKTGGGIWCSPVIIPNTGASHGVIRLLASRWPGLTKARVSPEEEPRKYEEKSSTFSYGCGCLDSDLFELCYSVSDVEGEWGEFSRSLVVSSRFLIRNDSEKLTIAVKQTGSSDSSLLRLAPGQVKPFYWADFRLPGLVSVYPVIPGHEGQNAYKWSGGFDICNLGMVPIRVRQKHFGTNQNESDLLSLRATIEVRPGTGGTGINVSFKEEDPKGDGSLFRIENLSPFPIWLGQDGVLANPSNLLDRKVLPTNARSGDAGAHGSWLEDYTRLDGDLIRPHEKFAFALDVPYRQGKYSHRKEASMAELLRLRVALAPLSNRAGIETMKVIGLSTVGESLRLNPSKVVGPLMSGARETLQQIRILAVISSDGPTRVLKFILISYPAPDVFRNAFEEVSYMSSTQSRVNHRVTDSRQQDFTDEITDTARRVCTELNFEQLPTEEDVKQETRFGETTAGKGAITSLGHQAMDEIYSIRAEFGGFVFSFVDSAPSEIAVASIRNLNALARWNKMRTNDASLIFSIGWLQLDNHVPSAPFKVAFRPDKDASVEDDEQASDAGERSTPLVVVALAFAPKHKSGIMCLRSVTVAPRNLVIALDLAFLVRLQRFALGLKGHFQHRQFEDSEGSRSTGISSNTEQKRYIPFPHFESPEQILKRAAAFGVENQKLYFQGLTILPCNITLSVAPARALTPTQASLEGTETAAIHMAVRKGDVLVGSSSALLGVRVGRRNKTPLSVVRGVFKSIVVDALLRLDGASLNFSGVVLKNRISTGPQLTTYLLAHYLASLRDNVPALLGSLAAFGNPLGLIRGLGDGVSDFVSEPVKGLKKSVEELNPAFLVDGVARGTESLARHTVGGFADSASLLTETFSKNMAVLTLDRRYAQKRDRDKALRLHEENLTLVGGVESGLSKLVHGFQDGVTGVVKAPIRGAEKRGIEGFAKGVGKGLLGLVVKPVIGISDAATDVMIGVKSSVQKNAVGQNLSLNRNQFRPRRPMYGRDKVLRPFKIDDAVAATLMLQTRCAGENYLSHMDMDNQVALFSVVQLILLGSDGKELLALKYVDVNKCEVGCVHQKQQEGGSRSTTTDGGDTDENENWNILVTLNSPRLHNGSDVKEIVCQSRQEAIELCSHIKQGMDLINEDAL